MRKIFQHVEKSRKSRNLHPTRCNENQEYEFTYDMFYQKPGQKTVTNTGGGINSSPEKPWMVERMTQSLPDVKYSV